MPEHTKVCGFATIQCPLGCGHNIFRKDTEKHTKDECAKTILDCDHKECSEKIERALHREHVTQLCPKRIVKCKYSQFGCPQADIKAESMDAHNTEYMTKHLQFQGMIRMFGNDVSAIPNGWLLCDGSNGTPDLRDKFVLKNDKTEKKTYDAKAKIEEDEFEISEIDEDEDDDDESPPVYSMIYIMKS